MAKKQVLKFECDNCRVEGEPDYDNAPEHIPNPLPVGWVVVTVAQDGGYLFEGEICDKCNTGIMNALRKRHKDD